MTSAKDYMLERFERSEAILSRHPSRPRSGRLDRGRVPLQLRHAETGVLGLSHRYAGRSIWGAELAAGAGRERIYIVEPTGPIVDDPNLTDKRFPGNPTQSYRSRDPLRVMGEVDDWVGHSPERLKQMKDHLERLRAQGVEAID